MVVHLVRDADLTFRWVGSVKSPGVLHEGPFPCDRKSEKKGVQSRIVETLTDEATGCEQESLFGFWNRFQLLLNRSSLFGRAATVQNHDVFHQVPKAFLKNLQVLLSLGQQDRGALLSQCLQNIVDDRCVAAFIACQKSVDFLNRQLAGVLRELKIRVTDDQPIPKRTLRIRYPRINLVVGGSELHVKDRLVPVSSACC